MISEQFNNWFNHPDFNLILYTSINNSGITINILNDNKTHFKQVIVEEGIREIHKN